MKERVLSAKRLLLGAVVSALGLTAAADVSYFDPVSGETKSVSTYTTVSSGTATIGGGNWYVVNSNVSRGSINVNGTAYLIVCDGVTLTLTGGSGKAGLQVNKGNTLYIYGQEESSGKLKLTGGGGAPGLGSAKQTNCGKIVVNGCRIWSDNEGSCVSTGIGASGGLESEEIILNGGTLDAGDGYSGASIGVWVTRGVEINGGSLYAKNGIHIHGSLTEGHNSDNAPVYCVTTATGLSDDTPCTVTGLGGLFANTKVYPQGGKLYFYLPNGSYDFSVGGKEYTAQVNGANTTATMKIPYVDPVSGTTKTVSTYTTVSSGTATIGGGNWYVVNSNVSRGSINVSGTAYLIVCDGVTLTLTGGNNQAGLQVNTGNTLYIYGQENSSGKLKLRGGDNAPGLGSADHTYCGKIVVNGCRIWSESNNYSVSTGCGAYGGGGNGEIVLNGGTLDAGKNYDGTSIGIWVTRGVEINGGSLYAKNGIHIQNGLTEGHNSDNAPVYCVTTAAGLSDDTPCTVTGLGGLFANTKVYPQSGNLYLYLPNGSYAYAIGDRGYTATVNNANVAAKYVGTVCLVTLDAQGGAGGTASVTAIPTAALPAITPPTKDGYIFLGYFDEAEDGTKYYNADGTSAKAWDKTANTTLYAQWEEVPKLGMVQLWENGPYFATCNLGATVPGDFGNLYNYNEAADAVTAALGAWWRVPPRAVMQSLLDNCTKTWETRKDSTGADVVGYCFTSKSDPTKSIFLPAAGYNKGSGRETANNSGLYRASTLDGGNPLVFNFYNGSTVISTFGGAVGNGLSVRPVLGTPPDVVQLWENGPYFATCNLGAAVPGDFGNLYNYDEAADAALGTMGAGWRVPTKADMQGLLDYCTKTWEHCTDSTGADVVGYRFTSKSDPTKSVFLPAAGYDKGSGRVTANNSGLYRASTLTSSKPDVLNFYNGNVGISTFAGDNTGYERSNGLSVRAVRDTPPVTVTLDAQGGRGGTASVRAITYAALPTITPPTKEGYKFLGYFDADEGGVKYYNADGTCAKAWDKTTATTLYAQWDERSLPTGYTAAVAIQSSGTQWIDTKYKPTKNTRIVADMNPLAQNQSWEVFFGVTGNDSASDGVLLRYHNNNGKVNGWFCNSSADQAQIDGFVNKRFTAELKSGMLTIDEKSAAITTTGTPYNGSIYIFCGNNGGSAWRHHAMKLYSFKIYEGETLVRDFVPCVDPDGKVGLYDDVTEEFYGNKGSGSFALISAVTFDAQGGVGGTASVEATLGAAMPAITVPMKEGYKFLGYFDAAEGGTKYYNASGASVKAWDKTENTTLYAQWRSEDEAVPAGYTEAEAIQSSDTQWIDTLYRPTTNTRIVADMNPLTQGKDSWEVFFGVTGNDSASDGVLLRYHNYNGKINGWFCNSSSDQAQIDGFVNKRFTAELKSGMLTIDEKSAAITTTGTPYNGSIYIFCGNNGGSAWRHHAMKLYSFKIYEGETLERDFVPCVDPDGKVGLYDDVTEEFFGNQGSGSFAVVNAVTLDAQGGTGGDTAGVDATYGAALPAITPPMKEGYAFVGYFDAPTGGTKYYNADGTGAKAWDKMENTTLYAQWEDRSLPAGYTAVVAIQSSGTQWIDTGVKSTRTLMAEMDYMPVEYTGGCNLGQMMDDTADWRYFTYSGGPLFDCGNARTGSMENNAIALNTRYFVSVGTAGNSTYLAITNVNTQAQVKRFTSSCNGDPAAYNVGVFGGLHPDGVSYSKMALYGLKLYDLVRGKKTLLRDFVPCVNPDGAVGLYDLVTKEFYGNNGSGSFVVINAVTLDAQDGVGGTASVEVTSGAAMPAITPPVWKGYRFQGYFDAAEGGTKYYNANGTSAKAWDKTANTTLYAQWEKMPTPGVVQLWANGPYFATCNLGATKPEEYGWYFWWGDTVGYQRNAANNGWVSVVDGKSFQFNNSAPANSTYDKNNDWLKTNGWIDESGNLVAAHDAATASLGAPWRMMTSGELDKLCNTSVCKREWKTNYNGTGINGWLITGVTEGFKDKSIFLSTTGRSDGANLIYSDLDCRYWTSTPNAGKTSCSWGSYSSSNVTAVQLNGDNMRYHGFAIRPVLDTPPTVAVTFDAQGGTGGDTAGFTATAGSAMSSVAIPTKAGYVFRGYFDAPTGGTKYYNADGTGAKAWENTENTTLYAQWERVSTAVSGAVQLWEGGPYFCQCNLGATNPHEFGWYFWWGDTVGYKRNSANNGWVSVVDGKTSIQFNNSAPANSTYNKDNAWLKANGWIDESGNLVAAHDAATAKLGAPWRMFTNDELLKLVDANVCKREWKTNYNGTGVNGYLVTGKTDGYTNNSIFLPAAGYGGTSDHGNKNTGGSYWASTPYPDNLLDAWYIPLGSNFFDQGHCGRFYGQSVRPVRSTLVVSEVTLDAQGGEGGTTCAAVIEGEAMPAVTVPTKKGYDFLGYFDAPKGGVKYYNADGTSAKAWDKAENATLYAKWNDHSLPTGYTAAVAIQSSGTQWIDTLYTHKANTRIECEFDASSSQDTRTKWAAVFGARNGGYTKNAYVFFVRESENKGCFNRSGEEKRGDVFPRDQKVSLVCEGQTATWTLANGSQGSITTAGTVDGGVNTMFIFDLNTEDAGGKKVDGSTVRMKLYSFKIYEGKTLVRDFVPCVDPDGKAGLYDVVTEEFYGNQGSGSFAVVNVVTFDANGGAGGTASVEAASGAAMSAITVPTKTGYTFAGYFDANDKKYYNADGSSAANWDKAENSTLYAQWSGNNYTVTFELEGGSGESSANVTYGQIPAKITVPTKTGAKFLGFFTEPEGAGTMVFDEYGIATEPWATDANTTLYASWVNELYVSGAKELSFDNREVKPAQVFKPETLTSSPKGWEADAETAAILEAIGEGAFVTVVDPVTANATVWTPQATGLFTLRHMAGEGVETAKFNVGGFVYRVAFDANGGTGEAMEGMDLEYGAEGTAPACAYTRADYEFTGWNTRKDGTGLGIAVGGAFSNLVTSPDEVGYLYAQWEVATAVAYEVDVTEGGAPTAKPIKVPTAWLDENLPGVDKNDSAKVKEELEKKDETGLKNWQKYVLGVGKTEKDAKIWIDSPQQKAADKIKVKMREFSPTKGTGFTVKYRLDTELKGKEKAKGALAASPDFDIDVSDPTKDPTGLYTVNVVFVPEGKENSDEVVESVNTMGILKVPSPKRLEIVAVPWKRLAPDENQAVLVADLVKTATLTPGDKLHVYDRAKKDYKSWSYDLEKGWVALGTYKVSAAGLEQTKAPDQTVQTVARGSAVWLERQDASKPFYLYGQYDPNAVETVVVANQHNLIASPTMTAFRLNEAGKITGDIRATDQIIVPQGGDAPPKVYTYKNGAWGYTKIVNNRFKFYTEDDVVPVGTGFWYISKGGAPTINW